MIEKEFSFNFTMLGVGRDAIRSASEEIQRVFGKEDYDEFKRLNRLGNDIPAETRLRVDAQMYGKIEEAFGAQEYGGERLWHEAMELANSAIHRASGVFFPDQDKRSSLTNNIAWSDNRPSTVLKNLTTPPSRMTEVVKFEQGRQLGFALQGAQALVQDLNRQSRSLLSGINDFIEERLFIGRTGSTENYPLYSYHTPDTNSVVEVVPIGVDSESREEYPEPDFSRKLWIRRLDVPVRKFVIRDESGKATDATHVLYDPRQKDKEGVILKGIHRSLKESKKKNNGGIIHTSPYMEDVVGFRFVNMSGGRELRDRVTEYSENILKGFKGFIRSDPDDFVDLSQGAQDRMPFRRRKMYFEQLKTPIEMQVLSVEDWLMQEYEIGNFDEDKGMPDGIAHDLYDLLKIAEIVRYIWPFELYGIDHIAAKREASFEIAARLARKQRIYPYLIAA